MTKEQQKNHFETMIDEAWRIMQRKSHDYATDTDVLSNFKLVSQICGLETHQIVLVFLATKIVRLGELSKGKTPNNESITDTLLDNINYSAILQMLMKEKDERTNQEVQDK